MQKEYCVRRIELPCAALKAVSRRCQSEAREGGDGLILLEINLASLVGEDGARRLLSAVDKVLRSLGIHDSTIQLWHILRSDQRPYKDVTVQDVIAREITDAVCILFPVDGSASIRIIPKTDPGRKNVIVRLDDKECIAYMSGLAYSISASSDVFLHCICAKEKLSAISIYNPVKYACPYKTTLDTDEIRAYPRRFVARQDDVANDCNYSASKWKNVLDHLVFCKSNPNTEECQARQARRKLNNQVTVKCEPCGKSFSNKNALVKHNSIHHRKRKSNIVEDPPSPVEQDNSAPSRIKKSLKRRNTKYARNSVSVVTNHETGGNTSKNKNEKGSNTSILSQFNMVIETSPLLKTLLEGDTSLERIITEMEVEDIDIESKMLTSTAIGENNIGLEPYDVASAYEAVSRILSTVSRADIRQPSGRAERNAGEIAMAGVTKMLENFGTLMAGDVFVDVGAGIGNVILQVALQSKFRWSVGIEMRKDLTNLTTSLVDHHKRQDRRLDKVVVVNGDIVHMKLDSPYISQATHIFCSNMLFTGESLLALEEMFWLPKLRLVVVTQKPCPRHTARCMKAFCRFWKLHSTITVPMTYTYSPVELFFSRRYVTFRDDSLLLGLRDDSPGILARECMATLVNKNLRIQ
jgi:hypothetical protein